jgi:hypothetical protein
VAVIKSPMAAGLVVTAQLVPGLASVPVPVILNGIMALTLVDVVVKVLAERPFVIRRRLMSPGGWGYALVPWLVGAIASFLTGTILYGAGYGSLLAIAMTVVEGVEVLFRRAWIPGQTDAEYHEKWVRTKEMTTDLFAPEVAEIRRMQEERAMDGYRRKIAEKQVRQAREDEGA